MVVPAPRAPFAAAGSVGACCRSHRQIRTVGRAICAANRRSAKDLWLKESFTILINHLGETRCNILNKPCLLRRPRRHVERRALPAQNDQHNAVSEKQGAPGSEQVRRPQEQETVSPLDLQSRICAEQVLWGQLSLLTVALLWGTYSPAIRYLYMLPMPPTPAALTASRSIIQAAGLLAVLVGVSSLGPGRPTQPDSTGKAPTSSSASLWTAGLELGLWNFGGTTLQVLGLQYTTATRGAFLISITALLTPLLQTCLGEPLRLRVWAGCCLALLGTLFISADHVADASAAAANAWWGDLAIFCAAFFYSLATVRLGSIAAKHAPLQLACAKSVGLALFASGWLAIELQQSRAAGTDLGTMLEGFSSWLAWAVIAWTAFAGAGSAFLQTRGQSSVSPAQAQVFFGTTPFWSAIIAITLLGSTETLGTMGWAGCASIAVACIVAR